MQFEGAKDAPLEIKGLENLPHGIRLLNTTDDNGIKKATVFIPKGKESIFLNKLNKYSDHSQDLKSNKPAHSDLINSIEDIKAAFLDAFWTGSDDKRPTETKQWIEIWIRNKGLKDRSTIKPFRKLLNRLNIKSSTSCITFPERTVFAICANEKDLLSLIASSEEIAEIRNCSVPTSFFEDLTSREKGEWIDDLSSRTTIDMGQSVICILDSGVNHNHPLISSALSPNSVLSVKKTWNPADTYYPNGHGTRIAGIALYDNLTQSLASSDPIRITHKLESVKIFDQLNP